MKSQSLIVLCLAITPVAGFLHLINKVNPSVSKYAEAQKEALLKIHLDIGGVDVGTSKVTGHRLGVDGLMVELHGHEALYKHPNLPGANGPNPQLSSGAKSLDVIRNGKYVDMMGSQKVALNNGVWEMIWRHECPAGALIVSSDIIATDTFSITMTFLQSYLFLFISVCLRCSRGDQTQRCIDSQGTRIQ
jgi:hypothetical protein